LETVSPPISIRL